MLFPGFPGFLGIDGRKLPLGSAIQKMLDENKEEARRKRVRRFRQARERFGVEVMGVVYLPCTREVEKFLYDEHED